MSKPLHLGTQLEEYFRKHLKYEGACNAVHDAWNESGSKFNLAEHIPTFKITEEDWIDAERMEDCAKKLGSWGRMKLDASEEVRKLGDSLEVLHRRIMRVAAHIRDCRGAEQAAFAFAEQTSLDIPKLQPVLTQLDHAAAHMTNDPAELNTFRAQLRQVSTLEDAQGLLKQYAHVEGIAEAIAAAENKAAASHQPAGTGSAENLANELKSGAEKAATNAAQEHNRGALIFAGALVAIGAIGSLMILNKKKDSDQSFAQRETARRGDAQPSLA